jgi:hypothetical protein
MKRLHRLSLAVCLSLGTAAPASFAQVNVSIGINLSTFPDLAPVPGYPVYYAPQLDTNYFFYDGLYWAYVGDHWYDSTWYDGPWTVVQPDLVPVYVLRVPVRYYRRPPEYFHAWAADQPPRWGEHWGPAWQDRHRDWDHWNHAAAPAPAPLPVYQRRYAGTNYPHTAQEREALREQNYRYQPHDAAARGLIANQARGHMPNQPQADTRRAEAQGAEQRRSAQEAQERHTTAQQNQQRQAAEQQAEQRHSAQQAEERRSAAQQNQQRQAAEQQAEQRHSAQQVEERRSAQQEQQRQNTAQQAEQRHGAQQAEERRSAAQQEQQRQNAAQQAEQRHGAQQAEERRSAAQQEQQRQNATQQAEQRRGAQQTQEQRTQAEKAAQHRAAERPQAQAPEEHGAHVARAPAHEGDRSDEQGR